MSSTFIISLDFELFWGVSHSKTIKEYKKNILGTKYVIPKLIDYFNKYEIHCTWATVGMIMCKDYNEWQSINPKILPTYSNMNSSYDIDYLVKENEELFFAKDLIRLIKTNSNNEIASHTYSHLCCSEKGINIEQFKADMECYRDIAEDNDINVKSMVFPRNQYAPEYLDCLNTYGISSFRGNAKHWLHKNGHLIKGGLAGRAIRLIDFYLPITSNIYNQKDLAKSNSLLDIPASIFLRPWSKKLNLLENQRIKRIKSLMTNAAKKQSLFHLWWHPHNFGINQEENLYLLSDILTHFKKLKKLYGMKSMTMNEFCAHQGK